jgi:ribose-phosphate pyrophosphokinase
VHDLQNGELAVVAGPSSPELASRIAAHLKSKPLTVNAKIFSDGECKIQMPNVKGKNCVIVQSLYPPADRHLLQALMITKKCNDDGANTICNLSPYMAYARQDRSFVENEFPTMSLVARLFESVGTQRIVALDVHSSKALTHFSIEATNVSAMPILANYVKSNMHLERPIAVSPDMGGKQRIADFSKILNIDFIILEKQRDKFSGEVRIDKRNIPDIVAKRDIIILDDIRSTGNSIIKATEILRKKNPGKIYAMCSHSLITNDNFIKISESGVENIISTNSIPGRFARVDIAPALASCIRAEFLKEASFARSLDEI